MLQYLSPRLRAEVAEYLNAQLLRDVWLFHSCSDEVKESVALMLQPVYYGQNQVIFEEGAPALEMYFIKMGEVGVYCNFQAKGSEQKVDGKRSPRAAKDAKSIPEKKEDNGGVTAITVLGKGTFFGEAALIDEDGVRNATLKTLSPCELLLLERSKFLRVVKDYPKFYNEIEAVASKRRKRMQIIRKKKMRSNKGKKAIGKLRNVVAAAAKRKTQAQEMLNRWFKAVVNGDQAAVTAMVKKKPFLVDTRQRTGTKGAALHIAVETKSVAMIKLLLDLGANLEATDGKGRNPLELSTSAEVENFLKFYSNNGKDAENADVMDVENDPTVVDANDLESILEADEEAEEETSLNIRK